MDLLHVNPYTQEEFDQMVFVAVLAITEMVVNHQRESYQDHIQKMEECLARAKDMNDLQLISWYEGKVKEEFFAEITFQQIFNDVGMYLVTYYGFSQVQTQAGCWICGTDNFANPSDTNHQRARDIFLNAITKFVHTNIHCNSGEKTCKLIMNPDPDITWLDSADQIISANNKKVTTKHD